MKTLAIRGLAMAVGALYIFSALGKLADPPGFYLSILNYEIPMPQVAMVLATITLPWLELLMGLSLVFFWNLDGTLLGLFVLQVFFLGLTAQAWMRGLDISCGCFGMLQQQEGLGSWIAFVDKPSTATVKNIMLVAAAGTLIRFQKQLPFPVQN